MNNILNPKTTKLRVAMYERISQEDDNRDESCSVTNQRDIIRKYISEQEDLAGCVCVDYVDDGISGSHSDRAGYQRLMADVERGEIDAIIVKDLSRIGRNSLDVDDLLMNRLVTLRVRFIAIGNGYDSFKHPLSNLELAFINLANQHYNRDLAIKSKTAKLVKQKRGEYLSLAPYGYKKSETVKNQLVVDEQAAVVVRLIFSLAVEGKRSVEIAQILNAQGIPSPSVYKISQGHKNMWRRIDEKYCFWTICVIRRMIANEVYIGTAVSDKSKVKEPGKNNTVPRPRDEWVVVPNAHEAIVSESDFRKAQEVLPRIRAEGERGHIFGNKIKCPDCGHAMLRYTPKNPRFKCGTAKYTDHYSCRSHTILQRDIEDVVIAAIKVYAAALIDQQEIKMEMIKLSRITADELEAKIREEQKAIQLLESSVTRIFTDLASGKMTKETFVRKKGIINDTIANKQEAINRLREQCKALIDGHTAIDNTIAEMSPLLSIDSLDRETVDSLIDRILVHDENDIEIVWYDRV